MGNEDLPSVHHTGQGDGAVIAPVVEGTDVVDEDDKVVRGTFVEDLGGCDVGTRHDVCVCICSVRLFERRERERKMVL